MIQPLVFTFSTTCNSPFFYCQTSRRFYLAISTQNATSKGMCQMYSEPPPDLFSKGSPSLGISLPYLHELACPLPPCHLSHPPSFSSHGLFFSSLLRLSPSDTHCILLVYLYNDFSLNQSIHIGGLSPLCSLPFSVLLEQCLTQRSVQ